MLNKKPQTTAMETELFEQPKIMRTILNSYIREDGQIDFDVPGDIERVVLVASGSSYHSAWFAAELFGRVAQMEARAMYSGEFLFRAEVPHSPGTLYVFITQSGETADTNQALARVSRGHEPTSGEPDGAGPFKANEQDARAKEYNLPTLAVTNKKDSTIWLAADYKINTIAGEEKSIAATKTFTSQMLCLALLALKYAANKGIDINNYLDELDTLPAALDSVLAIRDQIKETAAFLAKSDGIAVVADGISYAVAQEAALKIRETTYINSNPMILGEFMHGHVAVLNNKKIPLLYVETGDLSYTSIRNLNKITVDYAPNLVLIGNPNSQVRHKFNLNVPCESQLVKMFCTTVTAQLLALETALKLKRNVDAPAGLSKVVQ